MRSKSIYHGKVIDVNAEWVELPDGRVCELEIVRHPGGAAVVALDHNANVCLLRQYRHAADGWLWELPAGRIDPGEEPLATASRELQEEAGLQAGHWEPLGSLLSSPGIFTEIIHLFLARELQAVEQRHEEHEVIEVHWLPFAEAVAMAGAGEIRDAKTIIGLFRAQGVMGKSS